MNPAEALTFLIADDNPNYRRTLTAIVEGLGARARCVGNGLSALTICRNERVAGVLLDFRMPGGDGLVTAQAIRALGGSAARMPIVMISADCDPELARAARAVGVDVCLPKTARPTQIAEALHPAFARDAA